MSVRRVITGLAVLLLGTVMAPAASPSESAGQSIRAVLSTHKPTVSSSPTRSAIRPEQFSEIATGVAKIRVRGCRGGRGSGTGFLIGAQVVMTARHVIKGGCSYRVTLGGRSYTAGRVISWYTSGARDLVAADVATLKLSRPHQGYIFSFARRTPAPRTRIAVVGFPLGGPLSLNQGPLVFAQRLEGVPVVGVRIATAKGASGSAFLDPAANVVGILQKGLVTGPGSGGIVSPSDGVVWGLNLVRWWGPGIIRDLCRTYPQGGIPGCSGAGSANCITDDKKYLSRLTPSYGAYVDRWNAWIDSGEPLDEGLRATLNALNNLWFKNPDEFACSRGAKRVAQLIEGLQPGIDNALANLELLLTYLPGDPERTRLEATLDEYTTKLGTRLSKLEVELTRLGFFKG